MRITVLFIIFPLFLFSQDSISFNWTDHFSFNNIHEASYDNNGNIYGATTNSIIKYHTPSRNIQKITKKNGLNSSDITTIKYIHQINTLCVGYKDGSIDFINNNTTRHQDGLKTKDIQNDKSIGQFIYEPTSKKILVACGIGIIVINPEDFSIKETFFIGLNNTYKSINQIVLKDSSIYVATNDGIYLGYLPQNLTDFNNWFKQSLPDGNYNTIAVFNNKIYATKDLPGWDQDITYKLENFFWVICPELSNTNIEYLSNNDSQLLVTDPYAIRIHDTTDVQTKFISTLNGYGLFPQKAIFLPDNQILSGSSYDGIIITNEEGIGENILINGPNSNNVFSFTYTNNILYTSTGGAVDITWANKWLPGEYKTFANNKWTTYNSGNIIGMDSVLDIIGITPDPQDPNKIYAASWFRGLIEVDNNKDLISHNPANSSIEPNEIWWWYGVGKIEFDQNQTLWGTNCQTKHPLFARDKQKNWYKYTFPSELNTSNVLTQVHIDPSSQYKWLLMPRDGKILVFDDNNTLADTTDDRYIVKTHFKNFGNIPGDYIHQMISDKKNWLWIATDNGVGIFKDPENIFNPNNDAEQPTTSFEGEESPLLEHQVAQCITVDTFDYKWVGTQNGLYCINASGNKILYHFNTKNSPLPSNNIHAIISDKKNTLFIGTDKGILSLETTPYYWSDDFNYMNVFPNPVNTNKSITVTGLPYKGTIALATISGKIIKEQIIHGDQSSFTLENISPGTYLIIANNKLRTKKHTLKLIVVE